MGALEGYATNLSRMAREGKIDPLIGREYEVNRLVQTLARRRKNNPLLVGDSGVGKTAIVKNREKKRALQKETDTIINTNTIRGKIKNKSKKENIKPKQKKK